MSNTSNNKGIDIQTALSILSDRTKCDHEHHSSSTSHNNDDLKSATAGQVIQLYDNDDEKSKMNDPPSKKESKTNEELEKEKQQLEDQKKRHELELRQKFESMKVNELLQALLQIQSERVATYKQFQSGLDIVLKTNNMTSYPLSCTNVTATFSLQSNTINTIKSILLQKHSKKQYAKLIKTLQSHEKQKLDYTTAYHLECIRLNHLTSGMGGEHNAVRDLLKEGVKDLKKKIAKCMEEINDVLEEIRYGVLEEE